MVVVGVHTDRRKTEDNQKKECIVIGSSGDKRFVERCLHSVFDDVLQGLTFVYIAVWWLS